MKKSIYLLLLMCTVCLSVLMGKPPADEKPREFIVDGLKVIFKPSAKEIISIRLFIKGGTANYTKEMEGVEALALSVVTDGGTKAKTKTEFATALEKIGTSVYSESSLDYSAISMSCVKEFWEPSWSLFAEAITSPRFDEKEFNLIKGQAIAGAKQGESNPDEYLKNKSLENTFKGLNYSKISSGTSQSLEKLTLPQLIAHYSKILGKKNCFLVVVGNISEADLKQKVSAAFGKLPEGNVAPQEPRPEFKPAANIENREIATNYIRGTMNAPTTQEKDGVPMLLAMRIMRDRFFLELRTKRSLSYAPSASYASSALKNPYAIFYISTTDPKQSLGVMIEEINKVKNQGFTEKELKDMKGTFLTNYFLDLETNDSQTMSLGIAEVTGDWKKTETFMNEVEKATVNDLNAAFKKYSSSINWTYLGKESAVSKDDFKQPQILPSGQKVTPKK